MAQLLNCPSMASTLMADDSGVSELPVRASSTRSESSPTGLQLVPSDSFGRYTDQFPSAYLTMQKRASFPLSPCFCSLQFSELPLARMVCTRDGRVQS